MFYDISITFLISPTSGRKAIFFYCKTKYNNNVHNNNNNEHNNNVSKIFPEDFCIKKSR